MRPKKCICLLAVVLPLFMGFLSSVPASVDTNADQPAGSTLDLDNGDTVHLGPNEVLRKYELSSVPTQITGSGAPLNGSEYGNRTDTFNDETMFYDADSGNTTTSNLSVPLGEEWEGHKIQAAVSEITETRSWL
ncbi:MAG: hypothetical protein KGY80_10925, partial [Candidatus Thorarchaeota archaeon]|nr:hypothetical protein [Candidatus Thorarchaeota archaeon]